MAWAVYGMTEGSARQEQTSRIPPLFRMFGGGIFFFSAEAGGMLVDLFPRRSAKIKESISKADVALEVKDIYGAQILFFLLMAGFGAIVAFSIPVSLTIRLFCISIFGVVGLIYPEMYIQKLAEKRTDKIMHHLPFAIDLISSSMNAGLDFGAAVRYLLSTGENDVLRKEFGIFLKEIELGKTRTDALRDMRNRINVTEFTRFASAIAYGIDSGSSIIDVMQIQAEEMRRVKYARAEQQASKAPTKMIIPMAIFIFPSMFIMIFVPIFLRLKDSGVLSMFGK
jgi:tight adherence protein C